MPEAIKGEQLKITETEVKEDKVQEETEKIKDSPKEKTFTIGIFSLYI